MKGKVGFIGLGIMGQGMCRNLLDAGYDLVVWNRTRSKAEALTRKGAQLAETPLALAARVEIGLRGIAGRSGGSSPEGSGCRRGADSWHAGFTAGTTLRRRLMRPDPPGRRGRVLPPSSLKIPKCTVKGVVSQPTPSEPDQRQGDAQSPFSGPFVQAPPGHGVDGDGVIVVPREIARNVAKYALRELESDKVERRKLYEELGMELDETVL